MKKIVLLVLAGFAGFLTLAIIRDPQKVLPPPLTERQTKKETCPDPFIFQLPTDITKASSILYPGQYRGGNYKAHGGFRFDAYKPNQISVTIPYDAKVIAGARYPVNGEIQYAFDFEHPCGIRYRFMHLLTLTPKFQTIAEKFPLPKELDSRTTQVNPPVSVKQGELVATAVGLNTGGPPQLNGYNTFFDFGVYDYRQINEASQDPAWLKQHPSDIEQHAVCWFDWLTTEDRAKVLALPPADSQSGKTSDYCR